MHYVISLLFTVTSNVTRYYCMTSNLTGVRLLANVMNVMHYKHNVLAIIITKVMRYYALHNVLT